MDEMSTKRGASQWGAWIILIVITISIGVPFAATFAPVVNDALTTNETLAASRNAFLISHLFEELDAEGAERAKAPGNLVEGNGGGGGGLIEGAKMTEGMRELGSNGRDPPGEAGGGAMGMGRPIRPVNEQQQQKMKFEERGGGKGQDNRNPDRNGSEEPSGTGTDGEPETASAIPAGITGKPPQIPAEEQESEEEEVNESEVPPTTVELIPTSTVSEERSNEDTVATESVEATTSAQMDSSTSDDNATSPVGTGRTIVHPAWLRTLFFTVICTGLGFFILMLLTGLVGRCERNEHDEEQQGEQRPQHNQQQPNPNSGRDGSNPQQGAALAAAGDAQGFAEAGQRRAEIVVEKGRGGGGGGGAGWREMARGVGSMEDGGSGGWGARGREQGEGAPVLVAKPAAYL